MLSITNLTVKVREKLLLDDVSLNISAGEFLVVNGPNGAGKSTLLRAITSNLSYDGTIEFEGSSLAKVPRKKRASLVAKLNQMQTITPGYTASQVVKFGMYSRTGGIFGARQSQVGSTELEDVLKQTKTLHLSERDVATLSGGELQRVFLAQALLQDPKLLLLDEPTNNLDINFQLELLEFVTEWINAKEGRAVIAVIHDVALCRKFASRVLILRKGRIFADDSPSQAFCRRNLEEVYSPEVANYFEK